MMKRILKYSAILAGILFFLLLIQTSYVYYNRQYREAGVKFGSLFRTGGPL